MGRGKGGERMDDTTQQAAAPVQDVTLPTPGDGAATPNLSDLAGMTPPPAPVAPAMDTANASMDVPNAQPAGDPAGSNLTQDDYSYAEDVLDEILDSLDRIEAKVEAIEKKLG